MKNKYELLFNYKDNIRTYLSWYRDSFKRHLEEPENIHSSRETYLGWIARAKGYKKGDEYKVDAAAPGYGTTEYIVTHVNHVTGEVYGKLISSNVRILTESDVI